MTSVSHSEERVSYFSNYSQTVSWIPADGLSSAVIDLVICETPLPPLLNLVHPRGILWSKMLDTFKSCLGRPGMAVVSLSQWVAMVEDASEKAVAEDIHRIVRHFIPVLLRFFSDYLCSPPSSYLTFSVEWHMRLLSRHLLACSIWRLEDYPSTRRQSWNPSASLYATSSAWTNRTQVLGSIIGGPKASLTPIDIPLCRHAEIQARCCRLVMH